MLAIRALPLLLGLSSPALAQDDVPLKFAWPDGAAWRLVVQWDLDVVDPKGASTKRSGAVREVWTWDATDDGHVLSVSDTLNVRATPRDDVLAQQIGASWQSERRVEIQPDEPPAPTEVPGQAPAPAAEAVPAEAAAPVEGAAPAEGAGEGAAEAVPVEAAPVATASEPAATPAEAPAKAAPVQLVPDLVAFVTARLEHGVVGLLQRLDTVKMKDGQDVFFSVASGKEIWRLKRLPSCPDVGPGSSCVELSMKRYLDGAPQDGGPLAPGQGRFEAVWTLEPETLVIHDGHISGTVAYHDGTGDQAGTWLATVSRDLRFLDLTPPADLPRVP